MSLPLKRIPVNERFLLIPQGIHKRGQVFGSLELLRIELRQDSSVARTTAPQCIRGDYRWH